MSSQVTTAEQSIKEAVAARDHARLEEAWLGMLEAGDARLAFSLEMADELTRLGQAERAGALLLLVHQHFLEREQGADALAAARKVLEIFPREPKLREALRDSLLAAHGDRGDLAVLIDKAELMVAKDIAGAVRKIDRMIKFGAGDFVFHAAGWGVGRVREIHSGTGMMRIDFEQKTGHEMRLDGAVDSLERLPPEHFWSQRFQALDELRARVQTAPGELVKQLLRDLGRPLHLKELKAEFTPRVVETARWSAFWSRARAELKKDPLVDLGHGAHSPIGLLAAAPDHVRELLVRIEKLRRLGDKVECVRGFLADLRLRGLPVPELGEVAQCLAKALPAVEAVDSLRTLLMLVQLGAGPVGGGLNFAALFADGDAAVALIGALEDRDDQRCALERLLACHPERRAQILGRAIFAVHRDNVGHVLEALVRADQAGARAALEELWVKHEAHPDAALWLYRQALDGRLAEGLLPVAEPLITLERLLDDMDLLGRMEKDDPRVEALPRYRSAVSSGDFGWITREIKTGDVATARRLLRKVRYNKGVSETARTRIEHRILVNCPQAGADKAAAASADARPVFVDPNKIMATAGGMGQRQRELDHLVNVEVPKNQADIGRAIGLGDLSENAEYSAALERQQHLVRQVAELQDGLKRAHILRRQDVETDQVGVGCRVRMTDVQSGETCDYRVLGPWEADLSHGIISYLSPIGSALLGGKVGDVVEAQLPGGVRSLRIEEIGIGIEE